MMIQHIPQQQSTTYFSQKGVGAYAVPLASDVTPLGKALGSIVRTSPLFVAMKAMNGTSCSGCHGLGEDGVEVKIEGEQKQIDPTIVALSVLYLVVAGVGSYTIGKALAPTPAKQAKYAFWAVPIGIFSPYLGLGTMAWWSMKGK
jgi:hypothetical protein